MPRLRIYLLFLSFITINCYSNEAFENGSLINAIRGVGDQLLMQSADSTSRVLPVLQTEDEFLMSFEAELEIVPDSLVSIVKSQFSRIELSDNYLVEVISCDSNMVVYSYLKLQDANRDMLACKLRTLPKACYQIKFSLSEPEYKANLKTENKAVVDNVGFNKMWLILIFIAVLLGSILIYFLRKKSHSDSTDSAIRLGKFHFKAADATLILKEERIDLSIKEADLLQLLHDSLNQTVERDMILKEVWGDEGDYVGRTLDVFISKLRKKLSADPEVKIMNVRGVGYRLVVG